MTRKQIALLIAIILTSFFLRFYSLGTNPPGLYWDEAAFGYDAYSVSETAKDQHGKTLPLFFESFGDWKLPGYFYLLVPSIKIFGVTELAVRFPSALLGSFTVLILYLLIRRLSRSVHLSLFSSLALAISPWHIQFSRGGFESTAGLFFAITGIYLFVISMEKPKMLFFTFSFLLLTLSMYTYHAYRIFIPLFSVALLIIYRKTILKNIKTIVIPAIITIVLIIPLARFSLTSEGQSRAMSQSAYGQSRLEEARLNYDQKSKKPLRFLSKYLYTKPLFYSYTSFQNYLSHFSPIFLFFEGDKIGRHSQVDMGQIYIFDIILLAGALLALKKTDKTAVKIMTIWLLLAPIPAIIVSPVPHAYRTLQMVIPLAFFSGLGAYLIFNNLKYSFIKIALGAFALYWVVFYLHLTFIHYPQKFAADWQDGYKDLVEKIQKHETGFEKVYVTNINQVPYIYLLFFTKYDPQKFIEENGTSNSFGKYFFVSTDNFDPYNKGRILYAAPSWEKVDGKWLDAVDDSSKNHIYSLWEIEND